MIVTDHRERPRRVLPIHCANVNVHPCELFPWPGQNMLSSELGAYSIREAVQLACGVACW